MWLESLLARVKIYSSQNQKSLHCYKLQTEETAKKTSPPSRTSSPSSIRHRRLYSSISDATRRWSSSSPVTMSFTIIFFWRQRRKFGNFFWPGSTCSHCVQTTFICNYFNVEVWICSQFSVDVTRTRGQCRWEWNNCSLLAMPATLLWR